MLKLRVSSLVTFALVFFFITPPEASVRAERVVCSFSSSASHRPDEYSFQIKNIPVGLCTHVVFYRIDIDILTNELLLADPLFDAVDNDWQKFMDLRRADPQLKLLIALQSPLVLRVAADDEQRKSLVDGIVGYVERLNLDGVEIFWSGGGFGPDEGIFALVEDLKTRLVAAGRSSCEVIVLVEIDKKTTDHERLCRLADFVHVIGGGERKPVYRGGDLKPVTNVLYDVGDSKNLTLDRAVQRWIDNKCAASKMALSTVYMAQTYTLADAKETGRIDEQLNLCPMRPYCGYYEFCELLKEGNWTFGWDDTEGMLFPHAIQDDQWVSYESVQSIARKGEIARAKGLAGVYGVTLDMDDYLGKCGTVYPLTKALRRSFLQTED